MTVPGGPADVNAAWLQDMLRARAGLPDARVRAAHAERIGEGYGLDGVTARVHLDAEGGAPRTVVLKWARRAFVEREAWALARLSSRIPRNVPALLAWEPSAGPESGLLVLEDVAPARQGDVLRGESAADVGALLDVVAVVHAGAWDGCDTEVEALPRWGASVADEDARTRDALPAFLDVHGDALSPAERAVVERLPECVRAARLELAQAPATLIHADLHADNVLFRPDGTPVILDWPAACRGPAARDVVHPLVDGLLIDERRAHADALLARYAARLAESGVRGYGVERLRADARHALVVIFAGAVRWVARPDTGPMLLARPRALRDSLVRNTAAVLAEGWPAS